jgi:uncharacterized metal-binding protein
MHAAALLEIPPSDTCSCKCGSSVTLIYACSGASDVGEIADRAARQLAREGCVKMSCLAGIGVGKSGLVASAAGADGLVVIDGCPIDCGRSVMETAGFPFVHLRLTDLGFEKGASTDSDERIATVARHAQALLSAEKDVTQ